MRVLAALGQVTVPLVQYPIQSPKTAGLRRREDQVESAQPEQAVTNGLWASLPKASKSPEISNKDIQVQV